MVTRREMALASVVIGFGFFLVYRATEPMRTGRDSQNCQTNLRQIGIGMMQYMRENDNTLPRAWSGRDAGPSDATTNYKWMDAIFPYVKDVRYFTCPNDNVSKPYKYRSGTNYGSYVINNAYSLSGDAQTPPAGARITQFSNPYAVVLVTEGENDFQISWPDAVHTPKIVKGDQIQFGSVRVRHGAGILKSAFAIDCWGNSATEVHNFMEQTKVINGQTIYTAFTIEAD